jgi:sirohydrochlorin cobaltochelatase
MSDTRKNEQPVILIAAYGTAQPEALKRLEDIDSAVCQRFPGHEVRWALTSPFIMKALKKAGRTSLFAREVPLQNLEEVYADLQQNGYSRVACQCLLVHEGSEGDRVLKTPAGSLRVEYGLSLLANPQNIESTIAAVAAKFGGAGTATILVGHGSDTDPRSNVPFKYMDEYLRRHYTGTVVAMVHGSPSPDEVLPEVKKWGVKEVVFVPLMITNSEHILHDVAGEDPSSWKSCLGLPYRVESSLGETPAVMKVYFDSLQAVLSKFDG